MKTISLFEIYNRYHLYAMGILVIFFSFIFTNFSIIRHLQFNSDAFDLGIYTQISYLYSQGITPYSTIKHMPLLADHFEPILWILAPIYKLYPDPITILIVQSIFVTTSAIPLYFFAQKKTKNNLLSLVIITSYLTSVGIVNAIKVDFHTTTISVLPISLILYSWYFKKMRLYWFSVFSAFLFKEDLPILISGFALFQIISGERKLGIYTLICSILAFISIKFIILPSLWKGAESHYLASSILPLNQPFDLLILFLTSPKIYLDVFFNSPIKIDTFYTLHQPFAFMSLLSPLSWLTTLPVLFFRFSSTQSVMWTTLFHYNANLMPFITVSTILAITKFRMPQKIITSLFVILLLTSILSPNNIIWESIEQKQNPANEYRFKLLSRIPVNESVSAQSKLLPHLANREKIYLFPEVLDANYIVVDTSLESYRIEKKDLLTAIKNHTASKEWNIYQQEKNMIIFERVNKLNPSYLN